MSPANLITAVVRTHLKPLLAARGFTSSGPTFKRRVGEATQVVNVERSSRNGALAARFYINGSVYLPALDGLASRQPNSCRTDCAGSSFGKTPISTAPDYDD